MLNFKIKIVDKEYTIKDENELSLIFSLIWKEKETNKKILYNVIMQLDNELENIIITYKWLINCLKVLDDDNSFLLLIKLWDVLPTILKSSSHLWEILARIPLEKNKIRLLKSMRLKWLSSIINSTRDLWNIFEWIYEDWNNEVIDILGEDFIRKIFLSTYEIIIVLHYLSDKTNDRLIDILWLENIYKKIKTKENLLVLFSALTDNKAIELLNFFTRKEIKEMFNNQEEYYNFLLRLPYRKEKIFLNYLY
jgi:hypothetical protein